MDLELAAAFTHTAAIIIWRHLQPDGEAVTSGIDTGLAEP